MDDPSRRAFLGTLAAGGGLAVSGAAAATSDGHAAGTDVAPASEFVRTIPRRAGAPQAFTASLDGGRIKATSGGWARDVTTNQLPLAAGIAGAHLFLNPGGVREMHWHAAAEWGYVVDGRCRATVIDPEGEMEVVTFAPGDTWFFAAGHAHAIEALGPTACHAILAFDDGLYGEHGTFGLTDWMSRFEPAVLAGALGVPETCLADLPGGEAYIAQGPLVDLDAALAGERLLGPERTHRYALAASAPRAQGEGSALHVAPARVFPAAQTLTGFLARLAPGAIHAPHWHANANEWAYIVRGRARVTLFGTDKRMATADLAPGDCAYIPRSCGHSVQSIGTETCEIVGVHDSGVYAESSLSTWLAQVPRSLLAANLGVSEAVAAAFPPRPVVFGRSA